MQRPKKSLCRAVRPLWLVSMMVGLASLQSARAQQGSVNASTTLDTYGNARPVHSARRTVGLYSNVSQYERTRGYQSLGRRLRRRGGTVGFSLPGDLLSRKRSVTYESAIPGLSVSPFERKVFSRYGGFEPRIDPHEPADMAEILGRRRMLIEATSVNAPVRRAMMTHGSTLGPPAPAEVEEETPTPAAPLSNPTGKPRILEDELRSAVTNSFRASRSEAWAWFKDGAYRRAAGTFESAVIVDAEDGAARIGTIFCYATIDSMRTALALLGQLNRHIENPFVYDLDVTAKYGDPIQARVVRTESGLFAEANRNTPGVAALHALILWYVGDRDAAFSAAEAMAAKFPKSEYADWPEKMAASGRLSGPSRASQGGEGP